VELDRIAEHVGPSHIFIFHAQQRTWGDLVAAVLDGGADLSRKMWVDIFAVRQWSSSSPDLNFSRTIKECESSLCVCSNALLRRMESLSALSGRDRCFRIEDRNTSHHEVG
jgi:hypothetical protein